MTERTLRRDALAIFRAGLAAANPATAVERSHPELTINAILAHPILK
jgi:hypothetical protein